MMLLLLLLKRSSFAWAETPQTSPLRAQQRIARRPLQQGLNRGGKFSRPVLDTHPETRRPPRMASALAIDAAASSPRQRLRLAGGPRGISATTTTTTKTTLFTGARAAAAPAAANAADSDDRQSPSQVVCHLARSSALIAWQPRKYTYTPISDLAPGPSLNFYGRVVHLRPPAPTRGTGTVGSLFTASTHG